MAKKKTVKKRTAKKKIAKKATLSGLITADGALIEIFVRLSVRQQNERIEKGEAMPPRIKVMALLDPGASRSWIDEYFVTSLGLPSIGESDYRAVSHHAVPSKTLMYEVGITLAQDNRFNLDIAPVGVAPNLKNEAFKVILGRDFLAQVRFIYDGISARFELTYEV